MLSVDGQMHHLSDGTWVNLNDFYGYVPYEGTAFDVQRVNNTGVTYFNVNIDHGKNPDGEAYAYTLLPGANREETADYAASPDVEILSMTNEMHAVKDTQTGDVYINVFESGGSLVGLTFYNPCAIIISGNKFYVSDPSWNYKSVRIGFEKNIDIASEDEVSVDADNIVNVNMPIHGKTYSFDAVGY